MTNYELKPENVQAEKFNRGESLKSSNWYKIVNLLGPHRAAAREFPEEIIFQVFDVATMEWNDVLDGQYVVKYGDDSVQVLDAVGFEAQYREARIPTSMFPQTTLPGIYGKNGVL